MRTDWPIKKELRQTASIHITKISGSKSIEADDLLAIEEPLEIRIAYSTDSGYMEKNIAITMRTPGHENELAAGFLFTEGIISDVQQIEEINHISNDENLILVRLKKNVFPDLKHAERNFYTTSSCGICGKASIEAIRCEPAEGIRKVISISVSLLYSLPEKLKDQQQIFKTTGGLHAAALFNKEGELVLLREDIGRHNALDKLIGASFLDNIIPSDHILLLSGRASFELIQKAAMAGISIIASVGAPSSLAAELAVEKEITLAGFLRGEHVNLYSDINRIHY